MGKVIRADKEGVQKLRAKEIVPGDIVEISGKFETKKNREIVACGLESIQDFLIKLDMKPCIYASTRNNHFSLNLQDEHPNYLSKLGTELTKIGHNFRK